MNDARFVATLGVLLDASRPATRTSMETMIDVTPVSPALGRCERRAGVPHDPCINLIANDLMMLTNDRNYHLVAKYSTLRLWRE